MHALQPDTSIKTCLPCRARIYVNIEPACRTDGNGAGTCECREIFASMHVFFGVDVVLGYMLALPASGFVTSVPSCVSELLVCGCRCSC